MFTSIYSLGINFDTIYIVFLPPKILNPESTCIISPVIPLDKSLIKNSAVSPTSDGSVKRRRHSLSR